MGGAEQKRSWGKEWSIAFKEIPQLTSNEVAEDERMRRLTIASLNHYALEEGGEKKKKKETS